MAPRFVGGINDATGLTRIGARDYDTLLGRFVTVDPVQNLADPLQWNPYIYANNSPVTHSDPSGKMFDSPNGPQPRPSRDTHKPRTRPGPPSSSGQNRSSDPQAPARDPQVEAWQTAGHVGVAVLSILAVGAICGLTAGIGCLVLAGIAVGVAAGVADYAIDTVPEGRFDAGEAVVAGAKGGIIGGAAGAVGGFAAKGVMLAASKVTASAAARTSGAAIDTAATTTTKGGVGPVLKGQAGVNQVAADIEAAGGKVLGREVTVEANGVRTRPDLFAEDPCGSRCFVEVKNGPSAGLTRNQSQAFPSIQSEGFTPRGGNAAAAGLTPGQLYGPMPVRTVYLP